MTKNCGNCIYLELPPATEDITPDEGICLHPDKGGPIKFTHDHCKDHKRKDAI